MITALILIAIGLILALVVPHIVAHVIGWIFIAVGVILLVFAFLPADADARSSWSLLLFGPHMARVLRWMASKLDPPRHMDLRRDPIGGVWTGAGTSNDFYVSWPKPDEVRPLPDSVFISQKRGQG
jgi:hypothetical protein